MSLEACTTDTEMKKKKTSPFSTLFGVHWRRVILDEAHVIRNPKSGLSMGVCLLTAGQLYVLAEACDTHSLL